MNLTDCIPNATRVRTPNGLVGTVIRVSPKLGVLVELPDGSTRSYRPAELTKVEAPKVMGVPLP